jgi:heme-degrading monooxygenase HmoA
MFARHVSFRLKPNSIPEFTKTIEQDVLPLLRKEKGFRDEITFVAPGGTEAIGISLWDEKENAEAYNRSSYPAVLKALTKVVEGAPELKTFEVGNSTFHKIAARAAGA